MSSNETIKNPFTGRTIAPAHPVRPDWQAIDRGSGLPVQFYDAKSSEIQDGLDVMTRQVEAKYARESLKLLGATKPVPTTVIGEVRGQYVSPGIRAGALANASLGVLTLFDILITGGPDSSFLYQAPYPAAAMGSDGECHG